MKLLPKHGVLIRLQEMGIFFVGKSGIGKSETALQLILQGAELVCDDAPELTINENNTQIIGACPKDFYGLMHIRDIGIINIIELLGHHYFKKKQQIHYVIELIHSNDQKQTELNLTAKNTMWYFEQSSLSIPGISLHISPHRNIPLLAQIAIAQFSHSQQFSKKM